MSRGVLALALLATLAAAGASGVATAQDDAIEARAFEVHYRPLADVVIRGKLSDEPDAISVPLIHHPAWAPPVLSHGILYVRGKGRLAAVDLRPAEGSK